MKNVGKIMNIVFKVIIALGMVCVVVISLASAYIIFAPDDFPKPFRLSYQTTGEPTSEVANETTPVPTDVPYHPGDEIMFNMATKIINLADSTSRKYIRLTMVLEFAPDDLTYKAMAAEAQKTYLTDFETRVTKVMPIMDDVVISKLSTKTFEDLYTAAGKEALHGELIAAIAERVPEFTLISVYFTEFVVQ